LRVPSFIKVGFVEELVFFFQILRQAELAERIYRRIVGVKDQGAGLLQALGLDSFQRTLSYTEPNLV